MLEASWKDAMTTEYASRQAGLVENINTVAHVIFFEDHSLR